MEAIALEEKDPIRQGIVTQVGLITTQNTAGVRNIMAAEWTYQVSYNPGLLLVCFGKNKTSLEYISEHAEFGISTVATDQAWVASVAGSAHGREMDKVSILTELGVHFRAHENGVWTVEGAAAEFVVKAVEITPAGDHTMVVAEVLWATGNPEKRPLVYWGGKYYEIGTHINKPDEARLAQIEAAKTKHRL